MKKKVYFYKYSVIECVGKKMSKYIYHVKKKTCFGCLRLKEIRNDGNETSLKEGGGTEN